jgi:hypothetical protein
MRNDLTPAMARSVLKLRFDSETTKLIRQLLRKNNRGKISAEERIALEEYVKVGKLLDLLHAKARLALRRLGESD